MKYTPDKKLCIVSGASGDIGFSICHKLLVGGYQVVGLYGSSVANFGDFSAYSSDFKAIQCNFEDIEGSQATLKDQLKPYKHIDALICSAGKTIRKPAMTMAMSEVADLMTVNFLSAVMLTKLVLRRMILNNAGTILYIGSRAGIHGLSGQAAYAASKGAMASYAMSLSQEIGSKKITVNVIAPGAVNNTLNPKYSKDENLAVTESIALNRLAETSEIADLSEFLISGKARYITGSIIPIDGGARL